uniref:Uncharacterized protein n=1 Tax=Amphilophus citrinellus TaxID=61819 RepID=A0A3Q0QRJ7_AMPCI
MSDTYFEILRRSCSLGNCIPSGRQLPRTPPLTNITRQLDFTGSCEEPQHRIKLHTNICEDLYFICSEPSKSDDPHSMLKGMKGYELTTADLEFIKKMKEEQLVKKLQGELEEVQKLLKKETMALELACASKEKVEAELKRVSYSEMSRNSNALQTLAEEEPNLSGAAAEQQKKMVKAARVKKEKAEVHDLNAQESVQPVRGRRRKPAGTAQTTVSQQKNQSKVKTGEAEAPSRGRRRAAAADAAEEAQSEGPRRSKRIASKK